jgi:hypothetical protein
MARNAKKTGFGNLLPNFVLALLLLLNYLLDNWLLGILFSIPLFGIFVAIVYFGGVSVYLSFMQGDLRGLWQVIREKRVGIFDFVPMFLMLSIPLGFGLAMGLPLIGILYVVTSLLWSIALVCYEASNGRKRAKRSK